MTQMRHFYPDRYGIDGVKEAADAELAGHYDLIDAHLAGQEGAGRDWLVGETRTVADLFLFMMTRWGQLLEPPAWERPNLQRALAADAGAPGVARGRARGAGAAATGVRDGLSGWR